MAPLTTGSVVPPFSALQETLEVSKTTLKESHHPLYLHHLAATVLHNLQHQHNWTSLVIHTHSTTNRLLPRPIVSGLPPKRSYIHPDEQVEVIKAEHDTGKAIKQIPELEWVLPTHWDEKWSLGKFAEVFDAIDAVPPRENVEEEEDLTVGHKWRGKNRQKRLLLSTVHDDSTVIYYIMHDGLAKPRQN